MGSNEITFGLAFLGGLASFLSPCVLPIVPTYLSIISGLSFDELQAADSVKAARWRLFSSAIAFIIGFSVVSILILGTMAALLSSLDDGWKDLFRWVGGVVVLVFALHMFGVFRIQALFAERRFHVHNNKFGIFGAVLIGAAFGFGWTPCIGPTLAGILALASGSETPGTAWWMLVVYTLGLAVPFLLTAVFVNLFLGSMRNVTRHLRTVEIVSGVLLLVMGVLLVTDSLNKVSELGGKLFGS